MIFILLISNCLFAVFCFSIYQAIKYSSKKGYYYETAALRLLWPLHSAVLLQTYQLFLKGPCFDHKYFNYVQEASVQDMESGNRSDRREDTNIGL